MNGDLARAGICLCMRLYRIIEACSDCCSLPSVQRNMKPNYSRSRPPLFIIPKCQNPDLRIVLLIPPRCNAATSCSLSAHARTPKNAPTTSLLGIPSPSFRTQQLMGSFHINASGGSGAFCRRISCCGRIAPQLSEHDIRIASSQGRRGYRGGRAFGLSDGSNVGQERVDGHFDFRADAVSRLL